MNKRMKTTAIILGVFALVIVTTATSFAFFTYSRTGTHKTTISTGDLEFSYFENKDNVTITNQYPLADSIGANDTNFDYKFEVGVNASSYNTRFYDIILVSNNYGSDNYFKNSQIKFALLQGENFVAGTSSTAGKRLSDVVGFNPNSSNGEGIILANVFISTDYNKHSYTLRTWIADDVDYSNTVDGQDEATSVGKYSNATYSLKVKIESTDYHGYISNISYLDNGDVSISYVTARFFENYQYAITNTKSSPLDSEWIDGNATSPMSLNNQTKVLKVDTVAEDILTFTFTPASNGTYYLHFKDNNGNVEVTPFVIDNLQTI